MDNDESIRIDPALFGMLLKKARLEAGYRRAEDFIAEVQAKTGYSTSKATYYRIESGEREPSLNLFIAISLTLSGMLFDEGLISMSIPKAWQEIALATFVEHIQRGGL